MTEKRCPRCEETKSVDLFVRDKSRPNGVGVYCRPCQREMTNAQRLKDPEAWNARMRAWGSANPERRARYRRQNLLRGTYGMEMHEYDALLLAQGHCCAGCGKHESECVRQRLFVDHDHDSGQVRGLLCQNCNFALGLVEENPETLARLIQYVSVHAESEVN